MRACTCVDRWVCANARERERERKEERMDRRDKRKKRGAARARIIFARNKAEGFK